MIQRQIVTGFFENKAEAQQAVQRLLGNGFTAEQVVFSTPIGSRAVGTNESAASTQERNSGRFFFALFGSNEEPHETIPGQGMPEAKPIRWSVAQVTVDVETALEIDQAVDLLKGAWDVTIGKPIG